MTDTYGNEPHDSETGHDDALAHDGHVSEEPSGYEFADDHGSAAANEHQEEHTPLPQEAAEQRRSPMLPILAAVGGVLILGAAAWWQFGSSTSSAPAPASDMAMAPPPVMTAPADTTKNINSTAPSIADAAPAPAPAPIAPSNVVPDTSVTPTAADSMPIQQAAPSVTPTAAAVLPTPAPVTPATTAMPSMAAMPMAMPSTAAPAGNEDQRITALTARIDSLQKALDQANLQLNQMTNALAANASPAPSSKEMQDKVDHLEQELAQLHHTAPSLAAPVVLPGDMTVTETTETRTPVVASHKAVHSHKKPKPAVIAAHKTKKTAPVTVEAPPVWILRSASPGQAWVSTSATSSDLKQLQVGDSLAGIGRVTAIQHQGDDWVVQGTNGSIH